MLERAPVLHHPTSLGSIVFKIIIVPWPAALETVRRLNMLPWRACGTTCRTSAEQAGGPMARFIAIERKTGRVYGDTARFGSNGEVVSPADAVCLFDRHAGRAMRGFGYVKADSDAAQYDVFEIRRPGARSASATDAEAQALVEDHGSLAASLVTYNS
jgi:hypothetical protein